MQRQVPIGIGDVVRLAVLQVRIIQVVLAAGTEDADALWRTDGIELTRDFRGHFCVYDGDSTTDIARVTEDCAYHR